MLRAHSSTNLLVVLTLFAGVLFAGIFAWSPHLDAQQTPTVPPASTHQVDPPSVLYIYLPIVARYSEAADTSSNQSRAFADIAEVVPSATLRRTLFPIVQIYQPPYRLIDAIPVAGDPVDRPAAINGDLNLALRGYTISNAVPALVDIGGATDDDAPQLAALFSPARQPAISAVYRVNEWNWGCGADGCRGSAVTYPPVTMLALSARLGEKIYLPSRNANIYTGGYKALILYADDRRITLKYTREDSPVWGYMIHIEEIGVDPALVFRYRELNAAGRGHLPALKNGDLVGYAIAPTVKVAIRDTGMFMDPRTRKDWWRGY